MNAYKLFFFMALGAVVFDSHAVSKQEITRGQGLLTRGKPDYKALGIRAGSFKILPGLNIQNEWKDNIFSAPTQAKEDFIFHVQPLIGVISDWNRHSLGFVFDGDFQTFAENGTEDKDNYSFGIKGKFDVVKNSFAYSKLLYSNQFENRGDATSVFIGQANTFIAKNPTNYETLAGTLGYEHKTNRVRLTLENETMHIKYFDGVSQDDNSIIIRNDQNRSRLRNESSFRVGYELNQQYEAFFKTSYNVVDYDSEIGFDGLQRSSDGYKSVIGVSLDLTGKLTGDMYLGYQEQDYQDPLLPTISGMTGGMGLVWNPSGLTTVHADVDRSIRETIQLTASGVFNTSFTIGVDHELLRHIILSANAGYTNSEFQGGNNRNDDVFSFDLGGKYYVNRHFYLKTGFMTNSRLSNIANTNYDLNSVYLTLGSQL